MTAQQALEIIEQATGMLQLNRADHQTIMAALKVLADAMKQTSK